jgi:hypothetical protein
LDSSAHSIVVAHTVKLSRLYRGYVVDTGAAMAAPEYSPVSFTMISHY